MPGCFCVKACSPFGMVRSLQQGPGNLLLCRGKCLGERLQGNQTSQHHANFKVTCLAS